MKNSFKGRETPIPPEIKCWNWGAFFLTFIWAIGNRTWVGLLTLFTWPIMAVVLGFKGNEWAWRNKNWKDVGHFKSVQKKWSIVGFILFFSFMVCFYYVFKVTFRCQIVAGEHLESVDWLPASATDVSFQKRDGFGWIKNYDCLIPEEDFHMLAAREGWDFQGEGNAFFYEKRYPNGGGVTVNYDKDSKRLSVQSNHR